ncbi:type II toxin-antitoxin system VapC family toxin [uncultured Spirosoma sp.]|uniref:type II toxin-antitoxin system VapC family toxin n=1 Tax=uncultured Spirosoma sp. TaxID=278208 RepID=UPI00258E36C1|nr:type II toxin-antitoxin system VapC family toxin [uncultured Spirosoma sp.]
MLSYLDATSAPIYVSLISHLEVLGYHRLREIDRIDLTNLLSNTIALPITREVIDTAIELRRQRKRSLADSIIAATALIHSMPVLTNNVADFTDINGLQVIRLADVLNP